MLFYGRRGLTGRRGGYSLPVGSSSKWLMMFGSGCGSNANSTGARADVGVCVGAFAPGRPVPTALAITAAGGRYELDGLAAGRYQVEFTVGCGDARYATRWYQGATSRSGARPVIVTAGSVTTGINQG